MSRSVRHRIVVNEPMPMHRHPETRLVLVTQGRVVEQDVNGVRAYEAGEFYLRPAFRIHANEENSKGEYVRLSVSLNKWCHFFGEFGWQTSHGRIKLSGRKLKNLLNQELPGDRLIDELTIEKPLSLDPIDEIAESLSLVENDDSLSSLAQQHKLKPYELTRKFYSKFGMSPTAYRREQRLRKSFELMLEEHSLTHIAQASGFADQAHFSREFLNATGRTPGKYRAAILA